MSEETNAQKPSLIGMITSPVQQFERIRERPLIWGALAIILAVIIIGSWIGSLGVEVPKLEGLEEDASTGIGTMMLVITVIGSVIGLLVGLLVTSAIHMLIAKIAQSTVTFKKLFSMNTYIMAISALSAIVNGIVIALIGGDLEMPPTSLGSIIPAQGAMTGLWNSIEVFSIWITILTALGLQKVAGFSKKLAWSITIAFFIIGVIFAMIGAAINGMAGV